MQHAYLRALAAKWLSRTRSDSPSTVLSLMQVMRQAPLGAGALAGEGRARLACWHAGVPPSLCALTRTPSGTTPEQLA